MFITGAISTLIPYILFFGMLGLFMFQTYTKTLDETKTGKDEAHRQEVNHLTLEQSDDQIDYFDAKEISGEQLSENQKPLYPPPMNGQIYFDLPNDNIPLAFYTQSIGLRAPPVFA